MMNRQFSLFSLTSNKYKSIINFSETLTNIRHYCNTIHAELEKALPYESVPGPKPMPILGNTWRLSPIIGHFSAKASDKIMEDLHGNYGRCVKLTAIIGKPDIIFVNDLDEIENVLRREEVLPNRPWIEPINYYKYYIRKDFFGKEMGLVDVKKEDWRSFRVKVQKDMLHPKISKLYVKELVNAADELVQKVKTIRDEKHEVNDFSQEIKKWSLEGIAAVALDVKLGSMLQTPPEDVQMFMKATKIYHETIAKMEMGVPLWRLFKTPTWMKFEKALDFFLSFIERRIEESMKKSECFEEHKQISLFQRLLRSNSDKPRIAAIMAFDMFLVGVDTTSSSVASLLYQLSINEEVQDNLYHEIKAVLPNPNNELTAEKLQNMPYLKACIKEHFRLFPAVLGNARILNNDMVICGYRIPKGTLVLLSHYSLKNNERYFNESEKFNPARWLRNGANERVHPFLSLPFGFGTRMCIGKSFANLQMQTVICQLLRAFKMEYHYDRLNYHTNPTFTPDGYLKLRMVDRE